jgi:hypothetical protein
MKMNNEEENKLTAALAALIGAPIILTGFFAITGLWWSYCATILWGWFLVPLSLPALTLWQMWGIRMTYSLVRGLGGAQMKDHEVDLPKTIVSIIIAPLLALLVGYFVKGQL